VYFIYKKSTKKEKVDCQLSDWVYNNNCICDNGSPSGYKYKYQSIIKNADNGGISCPSADSLRQKFLSCNCSTPSPSSSSTPRPSPSKTIYGKWVGYNGEISITINYDNSLEYFQNSPEYKVFYNYNGRYDPYSQRICFNDYMCADDISQNGAVFKLDDIDNNKAILDYGVDHPKGIFTRV
jgi:hypothetical protein